MSCLPPGLGKLLLCTGWCRESCLFPQLSATLANVQPTLLISHYDWDNEYTIFYPSDAAVRGRRGGCGSVPMNADVKSRLITLQGRKEPGQCTISCIISHNPFISEQFAKGLFSCTSFPPAKGSNLLCSYFLSLPYLPLSHPSNSFFSSLFQYNLRVELA